MYLYSALFVVPHTQGAWIRTTINIRIIDTRKLILKHLKGWPVKQHLRYLLPELVSTMTMSFFSFMCMWLDCSPVSVSPAAVADDGGGGWLTAVTHQINKTFVRCTQVIDSTGRSPKITPVLQKQITTYTCAPPSHQKKNVVLPSARIENTILLELPFLQ